MRGTVMTNKSKKRLEKMNFLSKERRIEQEKSIEGQNENIPRFARGGLRS